MDVTPSSNRRANRLAHVFRELGLKPGERLVWCGPNSPGVVVGGDARAKVGATAVPLNYRLTAGGDRVHRRQLRRGDRLRRRRARGDVRAHPRRRSRACAKIVIDGRGGCAPPGMIDADALAEKASDVPSRRPCRRSMAASMFYTSGTTGRPKGAVRQPLDPAALMPLLKHIGFVEDDVYLTTGPLYHSGPGRLLQIAHLLGNTAVTQRRFDAEDWLRLVEKYRVTMTFSAPTPIRLVVNLPAAVKARYDRSSMKRMIANAAPWSFALKEQYLADFPEDSLWEVYGSTELGVDTVLAPKDQRRKPGSCGAARAPGGDQALRRGRGGDHRGRRSPARSTSEALNNFVQLSQERGEVRRQAGARIT